MSLTDSVRCGEALFFLSETGMRTSGPATTPLPPFSEVSYCCHKALLLCSLACLVAHSDIPCPLVLLLKVPHILPPFLSSRLVPGPAEKRPPAVRSGVIYHGRLCGELTFVQAFCSTIVIDSPCLFEDTNRYNYVRTPLGYILPFAPRKTTGELSLSIS